MKTSLDISNAPLGSRIVHLHANGNLNGVLLERNTPDHQVIIRTDIGEYAAAIGNVQFVGLT